MFKLILTRHQCGLIAGFLLAVGVVALLACNLIPPPDEPPQGYIASQALMSQTQEETDRKSTGCVSCHQNGEGEPIEPMHESSAVKLGCTDCHGGNSAYMLATGIIRGSKEFDATKKAAHVLPRYPDRWLGRDGKYSAANPERSYTLLNIESPEFIRFVNPGDLRVAQQTCGGCHQQQVNAVAKSTMTTSAIFWAAAAYANGILPFKNAIFGESYGRDGRARKIEPKAPLTEDEKQQGALPYLLPLPQWAAVQPGDNFRVFEDGGLFQPATLPEVGNPNPLEEPGKPDARLSSRGPGTGLRISIPVLNLLKTRLNDPHLSFLGTNDHPGDYRSSGCTGCHVIYANDRDPLHSGPYAKHGHLGKSASDDLMIRYDDNGRPLQKSGHPIRHRLTRSIPNSQCLVCHMHQPNAFVNTYLGYNMWDYESDGHLLWPEQQKDPTELERRKSLDRNPEAAAARGRWNDPEFLARLTDITKGKTQHTTFADYHGHGWVFKAVYKRDRHGNLLDRDDRMIKFDDADKFKKAVHLRDIHLEDRYDKEGNLVSRGMHCVDCHFSGDNHGNGKLYGEYGSAIEIGCEDCHGTVNNRSTLKTSGPMAPLRTNPVTGKREKGTDLDAGTTPFGQARFAWRGGKLYQRSMLYPGNEWLVKQVADIVTPGTPEYNENASFAKTIQKDNQTWGPADVRQDTFAHSNDRMTCYSCHSSWITSCFGCHLPQEANQKSSVNHYGGGTTRQYSSYNPQVVREDVYMLGINGTVKGNKIAPVRSSSALTLSSENGNRKRIYIQQPPISAPGFSSQAFNPHMPHTVRTKETKRCTDCHISKENDNNAWMAQLLTLGTNFVNLIGRFAWVGEGKEGFQAVAVTEWTEPQAVIGSSLHRLAYPENYRKHSERKLELKEVHSHHGGGEVRSLVKRGEYLYAAQGPGGMEAYDIANIDNEDFSERIVSAPVSPFGQRTYIRSTYATDVALPTNMPIAPYRETGKIKANQEQAWHPIYHYAFITDRYEGLILTNVDTLADRDPTNNFFTRALTYNPDGLLNGAETLTIAGNYVYVGCDQGLVVLDFNEPLTPKIVAKLASIKKATSITIQFRYAFLTDAEGLKVVDVTDPGKPKVVAHEPIATAHNVYVARTYAYVAAGAEGIVIFDVERPERAKKIITYNAGGRLNDARDIKIGSTNVSLFGYVADGKNGLRVLQLTSPETVPGYLGFSPPPAPRLIATRHTTGPAVAIAKGLDRDRAVDESGNQVSVFNRIGARPFTVSEMKKLYIHPRSGERYDVTDMPPGPPVQRPGLADVKK